jgi:hypothetical protein
VTIGDVRSDPSAASLAPPPAEAPRVTNWMIAGLVVAVMLGMAALGLAFALQTVGVRRANDSKGAQPPEPAVEAVALAPSAWPGLGFLPAEVQIVAGVRVADALDSAAGRALLGPLGLTDANKTTILGVTPSRVDHLVIGANVRTLPPRVMAVVHGSIGDAPGPGRTTEHHGKTLHRIKLWATGPEGAVWRADRRTLIAAQLPEDFDRVPAGPHSAIPHSELLDRLDPAALAWLVAKVDANNTALALVTPYLPPADRDAWTKLDALSVSLRADGSKLTLTMHLHGQDAAGEAIAKVVAESFAKAGLAPERTAAADWHSAIRPTAAALLPRSRMARIPSPAGRPKCQTSATCPAAPPKTASSAARQCGQECDSPPPAPPPRQTPPLPAPAASPAAVRRARESG